MVTETGASSLTAENVRTLTFAHSPDPDDAYMFYGFSTGAVGVPGYRIEHHLEDIQSLNERALKGDFEITAVSAHAYAYLTDRYWVMTCGASVGRGYGPILISKTPNETPKQIAVPGRWTTAALALDIWLAELGITAEKVLLPFDQILPAVTQGHVESGVIIHEGQLTYEKEGAKKIWDAGEWWLKKTGLPLPLGLDVVRSDLGLPLAKALSQALRESIHYANANREAAIDYALQYGRGLNRDLGKRFVGMYVNQDTLDQGPEVQKGLERLYEEAYRLKLLPKKPTVLFV